MTEEGKCPYDHIAGIGRTNRDWWPNQLRLGLLHQHSEKSDPMGQGFDYAAAFRTLDVVGLDTAYNVARNLYAALVNDEKREAFKVPAFMEAMVERKLLGNKTKGGFYKKVGNDILTLDTTTFEYRPQQKAQFASTTGLAAAGVCCFPIRATSPPSAPQNWVMPQN